MSVHVFTDIDEGVFMITYYRNAVGSLSRGGDVALLIARLVVGLLFIDHGLQKYHAKGGLDSFEYFLRSLKNVPFPGLTSQVVPAAEVIGGALLILGFLTRVVCLALAAEMLVTGFLVKGHDLHAGYVSQTMAGIELDLAYFAIFVTLLLLGPGRASLDALLHLEGRSADGADAPLDTTTYSRV